MTTDELITRAQHTLRTGQLNLAVLYMRKALEQTDQQRKELNPLAWKMRQYGKAISHMAAVISGAYEALSRGFERVHEIEETERKNDYALVGPGK